jgi:hypothetical protein
MPQPVAELKNALPRILAPYLIIRIEIGDSANSLRTRSFASLRYSAIVVSSRPNVFAKSRC